ncbi:pyridoxamine 5'-phosphate oxidase family protein [Magnetovibrio sp. PR-2]|uniref:HugZ family pyridoxamine 5'-phosphate oxidase n=1 Tax=Magnetovibrio sp. PR-2 TaxID=3120356 RepID=UPI002FCE5C2C
MKRPHLKPDEAARLARLIARRTDKGALATSRRAARPSQKGHPYVSKVGVAWDLDGSPLFLFSTLAAHTQDLLADGRASLLLEAPTTKDNPLEGARTTLVGKVRQLAGADTQAARARYLNTHPAAAMYADFGDFALWRMDIEKVHYVGGFGAAKWTKAQDFVTPPLDLGEKANRIVDSYAEDARCVFTHVHARSARGWKLVEIDPDGLVFQGPKKKSERVDFASPATDAKSWRTRLRALVKKAKA